MKEETSQNIKMILGVGFIAGALVYSVREHRKHIKIRKNLEMRARFWAKTADDLKGMDPGLDETLDLYAKFYDVVAHQD